MSTGAGGRRGLVGSPARGVPPLTGQASPRHERDCGGCPCVPASGGRGELGAAVPSGSGDPPPRRRGKEPLPTPAQPARGGPEWVPPGWGPSWDGGAGRARPVAPHRPGPDSAVAPALPSLLCQGLGLCQHGLPVHAGCLPAALHCEEEAAPGHVGRCEGRPSWGLSGQVAGGVPAAARCRRPGPGPPARPSGPPPCRPQGPGLPHPVCRGVGPCCGQALQRSAGSLVSGWRLEEQRGWPAVAVPTLLGEASRHLVSPEPRYLRGGSWCRGLVICPEGQRWYVVEPGPDPFPGLRF